MAMDVNNLGSVGREWVARLGEKTLQTQQGIFISEDGSALPTDRFTAGQLEIDSQPDFALQHRLARLATQQGKQPKGNGK